ncbi:N-(5'-phosphoribosyl)anthranilate isomerase [Roseovarius salinarum]|uniref:N-(5'-phosphoribosyl)anthranilate isomerase n=1 Tax=Roseovarius salinarum TaxID=1981892 RepID=UPI000C32DAA8|nr:N-(5'-phosphoribosyl)anthranilate isomerase [Roseovarius salinarum]
MNRMHAPLPADLWMRQIFDARAAREGGVVRRQVAHVERMVGRPAFEAELRRRGFHAIENAGHFVIFCNNEPVKVLC